MKKLLSFAFPSTCLFFGKTASVLRRFTETVPQTQAQSGLLKGGVDFSFYR